ncbi:hypothetical protein V6N11_004712 [Hibiscus sabdariffa]|uniref:Pentatricopeptide repeat-containing protein n=1 Tax=Hibiscus sabdariffa TaxID=183260 RepID=A0ABR2SHD3_9ROSI
MIENGCAPDIFSYNTMINGYCKVKRLDKAMELFHEISRKGLIPNNVTYNTLMQSKLEEALKLFQAMRNNGLELDIVPYSILMDGLCKARHINVAKELFYKLLENGLKPHVYTCTIMINGFLKEGLLDEAYQLFRSMRASLQLDIRERSDDLDGAFEGDKNQLENGKSDCGPPHAQFVQLQLAPHLHLPSFSARASTVTLLIGSFFASVALPRLQLNQGSATSTSGSEAKPKKTIYCACPKTKKLRDECIVEQGEEACAKMDRGSSYMPSRGGLQCLRLVLEVSIMKTI